jgi:ribonuclease R
MDDKKILELLRDNRQGLSFQDVFKELRTPRKERVKVEGRLIDLENRRTIRRVKNRYLLPLQSDLVRGRFETGGRGYGFVVPETGEGEDVFVPARFAKGAMHGDSVEVLARERGRNGKLEGRVVRVLKKEKKSIVGAYAERYGAPFIAPFDAPSREEIALVSRGSFFPAPGTLIAADRGRLVITDVFGPPDEPGVDTEVVIRKYGLAVDFSAEARAEADAVAVPPGDAGASSETERWPGLPCSADVRSVSETTSARVDYRGWTTFTIDGETAQDFDDAVSIRRLPDGNFLLGVHIADVSHYVTPDSPLDREAYARATSVYFPDRTLPMLPEVLSNGICSLRPREDRLTVSAVMEIDPEGAVVGAEFHPSIIRTAERMTYTSVFKIFQGDEDERRTYAPLAADLGLMRELARVLRARRVAEGSLDFDLLEPELVYREGKLHSIATFGQNEAHKLIEEFMVAANVAVASFLESKGVPLVFRVHPRPATADLDKLRETLAHFGIMLPKPEKVRSQDLQRAIRAAEGGPAEKFVSVRVLRAMRLAVYSPDNVGHYGLAKESYAHFTSPIRRYPDLIVHRILKAHLSGAGRDALDLTAAARHSSAQERNADAAEKDLVEWRIFRFLKARLGDEFEGIVVDITRAGLVVELDDYFVQGLVAYEDLGGDFFISRSRGVLAGKRSGKKFELGQTLRVTLAAVDPVQRRMSLVLIGRHNT